MFLHSAVQCKVGDTVSKASSVKQHVGNGGVPACRRAVPCSAHPHAARVHCRCTQIAVRVLTDNSGARRGMGKQEFLNRMADSLTAEEQVRRN